MKASELIESLQDGIEDDGDLEVKIDIAETDDYRDINYIGWGGNGDFFVIDVNGVKNESK